MRNPAVETSRLRPARALLIGAVLLLAQLPLILNPGYLSHDELEWAARADVGWSALPWVAWLDPSPLQYRPLTFNLWLVLAHVFAPAPKLMHLVFVLLGIANACLLARLLAQAGVRERVAQAAALVFALTPYAVYTHGWTGTLGDILTLAFGLLAAHCLQRAAIDSDRTRLVAYVAASALLIVAALLSKESAIVLPALLALVMYRERSRRSIRAGIALSAAIVVAYLLLRWPSLADSSQTDPAYAWSLRRVPARLAEYLLYPFVPPLFEISPLLSKSLPRLAAAAGCVALLLSALATAGWRWPTVWLAAWCAALAPVLVLATSYNHYAYLASATAVAICAAAWPLLRHPARIAMAALSAIVMLHGVIVMTRLHGVGVIQHHLYDDLLAELRSASTPLRIVPADARDAWLPGRLLRGVDAYRGVRFEGRVQFGDASHVQPGERLLWMNRDGHLRADARP